LVSSISGKRLIGFLQDRNCSGSMLKSFNQ
jgi:hypothetical protein